LTFGIESEASPPFVPTANGIAITGHQAKPKPTRQPLPGLA